LLSSPTAFAQATATTGAAATHPALPPGPPASVTMPPALGGVPPTPAPAMPGLPSTPLSGNLPSSMGLPGSVTNELRPTQTLNTQQVLDAQSLLAAGGFYRGPADGLLNGPTRAAVRAFQISARLPATGELDAQTLAVLGAANLGAAVNPSGAGTTASTSTNA